MVGRAEEFKRRTCINEGEPPPLAYGVLLYFKPVYSVPPYFGLAYCVPCNNKNNLFWHVQQHKEDKDYSLRHAQTKTFKQTLVLLRLLDIFQMFYLP